MTRRYGRLTAKLRIATQMKELRAGESAVGVAVARRPRRARDRSATWAQIGAANASAARATYFVQIEWSERYGPGATDLAPYHAVLDDEQEQP